LPKVTASAFGVQIHKRLMRTDPEYRNRVRRHRLTILGTTIPFCLTTTLGFGHLGLPKFVELTVYLVLSVVYVVYVLRTSLSTQKFQNEKVGKGLSE